MAKKDITSGFDNSDAQDFLEGYREDAMPTYRKAKKDSATESPPSEEIKEELARIPVNPERTKEEEEAYLRQRAAAALAVQSVSADFASRPR